MSTSEFCIQQREKEQQQLEAEQQARQEQLERERQAREQQLEQQQAPPAPEVEPAPKPLPALSEQELDEAMQRGLGGQMRTSPFSHERHRGAAPIGADRRKTTGGIRPALKAAKQHWRNAPFKKKN